MPTDAGAGTEEALTDDWERDGLLGDVITHCDDLVNLRIKIIAVCD